MAALFFATNSALRRPILINRQLPSRKSRLQPRPDPRQAIAGVEVTSRFSNSRKIHLAAQPAQRKLKLPRRGLKLSNCCESSHYILLSFLVGSKESNLSETLIRCPAFH